MRAGAKRNWCAAIDRLAINQHGAGRCHAGAQGAGNAGQINRKVGVLIRCNRQTAFNPFMIVGRDDKLIGAGGKICIKAVGLADEISIQIPVDRC